MQGTVLRWIFIVMVALGIGNSANAILPNESSMYEIPLMSDQFFMPYEEAAQRSEIANSTEWSQFKSDVGHDWEVFLWNEATHTTQFAAGQPIPILRNGYFTEQEVVGATNNFLGSIKDLLRLPGSDLEFQSVRLFDDKAWVHYGQTHQGLPVFTSQLGLHVENGGVNVISSDIYPDIDITTMPVLDEATAAMFARDGLPWNEMTDIVDDQITLGILPMIWDKTPGYFLVYQVMLKTEDPAGYWATYVDAIDGTVHWRINQYDYYTITGSTRGDVQPRNPYDEFEDRPQQYQVLFIDATTYYSDVNGVINATVDQNQAYDVTAQNRGRYMRVYNHPTGLVASQVISASPSSPAEIYWDSANSSGAERDCFHHGNIVHDWVKSIDPSWTSMDVPMTCNVNRTDGSCNAYWGGGTINFYIESGGCANSGQMADVIYHEYHHAVTQRTYAPSPSPTPGGCNEGFSDYCAMAITGIPCMSPGMNLAQPTTCMRNGLNERQYPATECNGQVHCLGEMTMGALWKTRVNLIEKYGPDHALEADINFRHMMLAKPYYVTHVGQQFLVANDDNANLADGTPDYWEVYDAFNTHNIPVPSITKKIVFNHTPIEDTTDTGQIEISAVVSTVGGAGTILPDSTMIYYTHDGVNFTAVPMTNVFGDNYQGYLPSADGKMVGYYIRSVTDQDITGTDPIRAPYYYQHKFLMGQQTTQFDDNLESDLGWTVGAPDDDATDGLWERVDPEGKENGGEMIQPENDHTSGGTKCFVTDGRGGFYSNYNVDNGKTSIISPPIDLQGSPGGYIDFWAFLSNTGSSPDDSLSLHVSSDGVNWQFLWEIHGPDWNDGWSNHKLYFRDNDFDFTADTKFRFECEDTENNTITEAALDDIRIVLAQNSAGSEDTGPVLSFRVKPLEPSLFSQVTNLRFQIPAKQAVSVAVYDVAGRLVKTLFDDELTPGNHQLQWDGSTELGFSAGSGVYFCQVITGGKQITRSVVLTR